MSQGRARKRPDASRRIISYDAGALLAAEARRQDVWALHRRALERGVNPVVPSPVLAQVWRGGPQHELSRMLAGCVVESFLDTDARAVGSLLARSGTSDVVDGAVVVSALRHNRSVVTSDPDDLQHLADIEGRSLQIRAI